VRKTRYSDDLVTELTTNFNGYPDTFYWFILSLKTVGQQATSKEDNAGFSLPVLTILYPLGYTLFD
jgi:hypothetical protein